MSFNFFRLSIHLSPSIALRNHYCVIEIRNTRAPAANIIHHSRGSNFWYEEKINVNSHARNPFCLCSLNSWTNEITLVAIIRDAQFFQTLREGGLCPSFSGSAAHFYFVRKVWRVYQGYQVYRSKPRASLIYNIPGKKTTFLIKLIEIVSRSFCRLGHVCFPPVKSFFSKTQFISFYISSRCLRKFRYVSRSL